MGIKMIEYIVGEFRKRQEAKKLYKPLYIDTMCRFLANELMKRLSIYEGVASERDLERIVSLKALTN